MAGLYVNFFRIFISAVCFQLFVEQTVQLETMRLTWNFDVWPLKTRLFYSKEVIKLLQIVMIKDATCRGIPFVQYEFHWPHQQKKDFSNLKFSLESYDFWIENWRNYKTSIRLADFRHDLHDMITQTKKTTQTQCPTAKHKWQRKNMITTTYLTVFIVRFNQ